MIFSIEEGCSGFLIACESASCVILMLKFWMQNTKTTANAVQQKVCSALLTWEVSFSLMSVINFHLDDGVSLSHPCYWCFFDTKWTVEQLLHWKRALIWEDDRPLFFFMATPILTRSRASFCFPWAVLHGDKLGTSGVIELLTITPQCEICSLLHRSCVSNTDWIIFWSPIAITFISFLFLIWNVLIDSFVELFVLSSWTCGCRFGERG